MEEDGNILSCNQTFFKMLDLKEKKESPINIFEIVDSHYRENFQNFLDSLKESKNQQLIEIKLRKNSESAYGFLTAKKLFDHILVTITDITELRETQRKSATYLDIIDSATISIIIFSRENRIIYVNSFYCQLTGYSKEELLGKNPGFVKSGKTPPETYQSLWSCLSNKKPWNGTFINRKKTGELFTEEAWIQPVLDDDGNITNYVAIKVDITEKLNLIEKEKSLLRAKSLITLSCVIAHHLNNINTPLLLISDYLSKRLSGQKEFEKMLDIIIKVC